jgi:glycosyltransferase involved in cell wall biosynthesis
LNEALDARGYETLLVHGSVGRGEASLESVAESGSIRRLKIPELGPRLSIFDDVRAFRRLLLLLLRESPDIVHTHTAKAGALGRLAALVANLTRARKRRAVIIHTFHGHVFEGYFHPWAGAAVRWIERALAAATDRIVVISPRQRADIVERFRVASALKTVVVPLGLDLDPLLELPADAPNMRQSLQIDPHDCVVGFVGRLVPIKNLDLLIRAFALARVRHPTIRLMVVGNGPLRAHLERLAADLGVSSHVRFTGWLGDLPRVYATMDLCALTSINEGTPVALIEAMAAGKAVVCTAVGGVPDLVVDGLTGRLVQPGDVKGLAQTLGELAADPVQRRRLAQAGRNRVAEHFSTDRLASDIDAVYRSVFESRRRSFPS